MQHKNERICMATGQCPCWMSGTLLSTITSYHSSAMSAIMISINQSKLVTPRCRWGTPTYASAVMAAHRRLSCATRSNDDINWPVHFFMLSFHDLCSLPLRRPPSKEPCSMIFGSVSWRQKWQNNDNLRCLTVDSRSS